jgi:hypothetical protein
MEPSTSSASFVAKKGLNQNGNKRGTKRTNRNASQEKRSGSEKQKQFPSVARDSEPSCSNSEDEVHQFQGSCPICSSDHVAFLAIGACRHSICSVCALRLRMKSKDKNCPICKTDLPFMMICSLENSSTVLRSAAFTSLQTMSGSTDFDQNTQFPDCRTDPASRLVYFKCDNYYSQLEDLKSIHCPCKECYHPCVTTGRGGGGKKDRKIVKFPNYKQLNNHLHSQHENITLCNLCLENRPLFLSEHQIIPRNELKKHNQEKHFFCQFCSVYFFDKNALYQHLQAAHHNCHLCDAKMMFRYYKDLNSLRDHHRTVHFVCSLCDGNPEMRNSDISYAFRTLEDYCFHMKDIHSIVETNYRGRQGASSTFSSLTASLFSFGGRHQPDNANAFFDLDVGSANPFPQTQYEEGKESSSSSTGLPRFPALETVHIHGEMPPPEQLIPANMKIAGKVTGSGVMLNSLDKADLALQEAADQAHQRQQVYLNRVKRGTPPGFPDQNSAAFPTLSDSHAGNNQVSDDLDIIFIDKEGGTEEMNMKVGGSAQQTIHPMSLIHQQKEKQKEIKEKESLQDKENEKKLSRVLQLAEAFGLQDDTKRMSESLSLFAAASTTSQFDYELKKEEYKKYLFHKLTSPSQHQIHIAVNPSLVILTLYPMDLMIWAKNNKFELNKIEKKFFQLLTSEGEKKTNFSINFKPMPYHERQVLHNLAKYYHCNSFEYDFEPNRYVSVVKTRESRFPWMILSEAMAFSPSVNNLSQSQSLLSASTASVSTSAYVPSLNKLYTITGIENPIIYLVLNDLLFSSWGKVTDNLVSRSTGGFAAQAHPLTFSSQGVVVGEIALILDRILSSLDLSIQEITYGGNCYSLGLKWKDFNSARNAFYYLQMISEALLAPSSSSSSSATHQSSPLQKIIMSRFSGEQQQHQQLVSLLSFFRMVPDFPVNENTKEEFDQYHNIFKEFVLISSTEEEEEEEEDRIVNDLPEKEGKDAWDSHDKHPDDKQHQQPDHLPVVPPSHSINTATAHHEDWEEVDEWEEYLAEKRRNTQNASQAVYKVKEVPTVQVYKPPVEKKNHSTTSSVEAVALPSAPVQPQPQNYQMDEDFALALSLAEEDEKKMVDSSSNWRQQQSSSSAPAPTSQQQTKAPPTTSVSQGKSSKSAAMNPGKTSSVPKNRFKALLEEENDDEQD